MANKYNIVVGVKIDQNSNISQQIQNAISKSTFKINLDLAHLRTQLQSVFDGLKVNVGGSAGVGTNGVTATSSVDGRVDSYYKSNTAVQSARGSAAIFTQEEVTHAKSVTTTLNEQGEAVSRIIKGYNDAGQSVRQYYDIAKDESATLVRTQVEEGTIVNKNAQSYQDLSARLEHLHKNGQVNNKQYQEFSKRIEDVNNGIGKSGEVLDEFGKKDAFKQLGQDISDAGKHAMSFGDMLKTAFQKFAIWSIATVNKLPSLNLSNLTQGCAVKLC